MTAAVRQTVKVYTANFEGCTSRAGFIFRLARAFSIDVARVIKGEVWRALCERIYVLGAGNSPVRVRLVGLDDAYSALPRECESLLRILRTAENSSDTFSAEAMVGDRTWKI